MINDVSFILTSVFVGLLPESIFFTLFFIFAKKIEKRRFALFGLIFAANLLLSAFFAFNIAYHLLFILVMQAILTILYKARLYDLMLISCAGFVATLLSIVLNLGIQTLWIEMAINRILLIAVPLLIRRKLHIWHGAYAGMWDRKPGARIKSVTIRWICCMALCSSILVAYFVIIFFYERR